MQTLHGLAVVWVACWLLKLDFSLVLIALWSSAQSHPMYDFLRAVPILKRVSRNV